MVQAIRCLVNLWKQEARGGPAPPTRPFMDRAINRTEADRDKRRDDKAVAFAPINIHVCWCTFTYQSSIELTIAPVRSFLLARARLGWMAAGAGMHGRACRAHGIPIRVRVRTGGTESSSFSSNGSHHLPVLIINFLSFPGQPRIRAIDRCPTIAAPRPPLAIDLRPRTVPRRRR